MTGPSRRQRRKQKGLAQLDACYKRQLAPKPPVDPFAPTKRFGTEMLDDDEIDFGPDAQEQVFD